MSRQRIHRWTHGKGRGAYRAPPQCGKHQKKLMKAAADERQRKRRRS